MVRATGWTWTYCEEEVTVEILIAISQERQEHPLTEDLVAAFLGFKFESPKGIEDFIAEVVEPTGGLLSLPAGMR